MYISQHAGVTVYIVSCVYLSASWGKCRMCAGYIYQRSWDMYKVGIFIGMLWFQYKGAVGIFISQLEYNKQGSVTIFISLLGLEHRRWGGYIHHLAGVRVYKVWWI